MNIKFGERVVDTRHLALKCNSLKCGDIVNTPLGMVEVITIQRECYSIEKLKPFTMVTCKKENGSVVPMRDLFGVVEVFRPRKR